MKEKIDDIVYNLELGCIDWQEASKQLFDLYVVVDSKRIKEQDLINAYQAGAIEQKGINPDVINLKYLKKLQSESDKWLKRYTE